MATKMYILNIARHTKRQRKASSAIHVLPATLYHKFENAQKAMESAIQSQVDWEKRYGRKLKVYRMDDYLVYAESETDIMIFRITDDTPEDRPARKTEKSK